MPLNIDTMQQEAMRRVQEMHSRTRSVPRRGGQTPPAPAPPVPPTPQVEETAPPVNAAPQEQYVPPVQSETPAPPPAIPAAGAGENLLETVFQDKERSLILLLILLLANESTKPEALLALMYLVM